MNIVEISPFPIPKLTIFHGHKLVWRSPSKLLRAKPLNVETKSAILSLCFNSHFPDGPGLADTRMFPFWITLELRMMKVVVTTGALRCAKSCSQIVTTNKPTPGFLQAECHCCRQTNSLMALNVHKVNYYSYKTVLGLQNLRTSSCFPFFISSMLTLMLEPCLEAPTTFVSRRNLRPCFVSDRWSVLAISRSMPKPPMLPRNSTRVTWEPSRDHTEP